MIPVNVLFRIAKTLRVNYMEALQAYLKCNLTPELMSEFRSSMATLLNTSGGNQPKLSSAELQHMQVVQKRLELFEPRTCYDDRIKTFTMNIGTIDGMHLRQWEKDAAGVATGSDDEKLKTPFHLESCDTFAMNLHYEADLGHDSIPKLAQKVHFQYVLPYREPVIKAWQRLRKMGEQPKYRAKLENFNARTIPVDDWMEFASQHQAQSGYSLYTGKQGTDPSASVIGVRHLDTSRLSRILPDAETKELKDAFDNVWEKAEPIE